ncbi:MAG: hypothetical protein SF187_17115 [Deltaproteobacteria bacterium]|nr:hypothetical protein [Deltaproteobacteria bacterium]
MFASLLAWTHAGEAADANTEMCLKSYESTQRLRRGGDLLAAHEQALICAQPSCAAVLARDCVRWLSELEAGQPTVTLKFTDVEPRAVTSLKVNGVAWTLPWDGRSVPVNPGVQQVEVAFNHGPPQRFTVLVSQGIKDQPILLHGQDTPSPAPGVTPGGGSTSKWRWAATGTAIAGAATFATFGVLGLIYKQELQDSCAPNCAPQKRDRLTRDFLIADVGLGVGLTFGALAAWLWWHPPHTTNNTHDLALPVWLDVGNGRSVLMYGRVF